MLSIYFCNFNDRYIKCTTTQIINSNFGITLLLIHTIGKCCRGRLIDYSPDIQASNTSCIFCSLALRIIKIGRNRNDSFLNFFTKVIFCGLFHLHEYPRRYFGRGHFFTLGFYPGITVFGLDDLIRDHVDIFLYNIVIKSTSYQPLYGKQGALWIGNRLSFSRLTYQHFILSRKGNNWRRGPATFAIFNYLGCTAFQYRNTGIGGSKVDSDNLCHCYILQKFLTIWNNCVFYKSVLVSIWGHRGNISRWYMIFIAENSAKCRKYTLFSVILLLLP